MRVRFRFAKVGMVRWTGHRDVASMWERALRRTRVPVGYGRGFALRPRISFGLALPTGYESTAEYLDVELDIDSEEEAALDLSGLKEPLSLALPAGIDVLAAVVIPERGESLQQAVTACTWTVDVGGDSEGIARAIRDADALVLERERKGRVVTDDLRPALRRMITPDERTLELELATQPRGVRPGELLAALHRGIEAGVTRRTHQWIERDGARWEPEVPPVATDAPHAELRAS